MMMRPPSPQGIGLQPARLLVSRYRGWIAKSRLNPLLVLCCWIFVQGAPCLPSPEEGSYSSITGPCDLRFPQDHGPHPDYRTEWWYYTGNLASETGERLGFQLTFFRRRISPPGADKSWPSSPGSAWRARQIYLAHAAITEISRGRLLHAEEVARGALGLADARISGEDTTVFVKNWSVSLGQAAHSIKAATGNFSFDLTAKPLKPPVLHGQSGYSLKGRTPERSSCYYSFTRLGISGEVIIEGRSLPVTGLAWMDHEFSSAPLDEDLAGWDWLSLQLDDGTELMIYFLRHKDGSISRASSGTYVDAGGEPLHLSREDLSVETDRVWKSPHTGAVYPSRWRIGVLPLGLDLEVTPNLADQELQTPESTRVTYWEGSVQIRGTARQRRAVSGSGYVELTGYQRNIGNRL